MNKKINLLLVSLLITFSLFIYLTIHHYAVKLGLSADAICSISARFNCDAAATSSFAEIFGLPIAVLGGVASIFLFGLVLFLKMDWMQKTPYALTTIRFMVGFAALASLTMALISLFIVKVICPFCTATYVLSFINLYLGWSLFQPKEPLQISNYFSDYKSHLIFLICIPAVSWMTDGMIQENYGLSEIKKLAPEKVYQWRNSEEFKFNPSEGLIIKGTEDKITVVEFADFKCPHCKMAATSLDLFLKGNPNVTFIFKPFPLDGTCNKSIPNKGDGSRCTLAAWTLCAEKTQQRGWDMSHWIFAKQEQLFQVSNLKSYLNEVEKDLKIDTKSLAECSDSAETYDLINRLANEGSAAHVEGTPTIFVNGKKLPYGQVIDILKAATDEIK